MNLSARHSFFLAAVFGLLFIGFTQYILLQPTSWMAHIYPFPAVSVKFTNDQINHFVRFHLADITWALALCISVVVLTEKIKIALTDRFILLSLPFITELLQKFHIINGTFDWYDILCYTIVAFLTILIFPHIIHSNNEKN